MSERVEHIPLCTSLTSQMYRHKSVVHSAGIPP